jgi:hypothetical protein
MQLFELEKEKGLPDLLPMYVLPYSRILVPADIVYRC